MDDPLVPESLKGNAKWCVYGGVGVTLLFVGITIILDVVFGSKKGHPAWFVLALAMLGILLTTCALLNWLRQNTVEDKIKYIVVAQLVLLVLLSIASIIDITKPEKQCPDPPACNPPACYSTLMSWLGGLTCAQQSTPNANCGAPLLAGTQCFADAGWISPGNGTLSAQLL